MVKSHSMRVGKKRAEMANTSTHKAVVAQAMGISPKHIHRKAVLDVKDEQLKNT